MSRRVLCILGTRPEVVKFGPVVRALRERHVLTQICSTGQHDQILTRMLIERDMHVDFQPMAPFQQGLSLDESASQILSYLGALLTSVVPSLVLVQGDTTTALSGALSAFHHGIPVGHVEAGLRTSSAVNPFPEEMNRRLISQIATLHFCPTPQAAMNLRLEKVGGRIMMTGNTIVDELLHAYKQGIATWRTEYQKLVLITSHRRETLMERLASLREQITEFALANPTTLCVWPLHPNPLITEYLRAHSRPTNLYLREPMQYQEFLSALVRADLVITDSGGVIEEATTLQRPLIIIRDETERPEALTKHAVILPLGKMRSLAKEMSAMLAQPFVPRRYFLRKPKTSASGFDFTFGNGDAGRQIAKVIHEWLH